MIKRGELIKKAIVKIKQKFVALRVLSVALRPLRRNCIRMVVEIHITRAFYTMDCSITDNFMMSLLNLSVLVNQNIAYKSSSSFKRRQLSGPRKMWFLVDCLR